MQNQSPSILIVEDQVNWQQVLRRSLEHKGYSVQIASKPSEAVKMLTSSNFTLVVLDMRLADTYPYGLQGLDILGMAKKKANNIIVLTGFTIPGLQARVLEMGVDCFMLKGSGFDINQFRDAVERLVQ